MIVHCQPIGANLKTAAVRAENDLRAATQKRNKARPDNLEYIRQLDTEIDDARTAQEVARDLLREHEHSCTDCQTERRGRRTRLPGAAELASLIADDGLDLDEVAAIYDAAPGTVRAHLTQAGYSTVDGTPIQSAQQEDAALQPGQSFQFPAWMAEGLCSQTDPEAFFPDKGESTRAAKDVCRGCPVAAECLDYALANNERFGVWGGLSERERRRLQSTNPAA